MIKKLAHEGSETQMTHQTLWVCDIKKKKEEIMKKE